MNGFTVSGASVWPMKIDAATFRLSAPLAPITRCITHAAALMITGKPISLATFFASSAWLLATSPDDKLRDGARALFGDLRVGQVMQAIAREMNCSETTFLVAPTRPVPPRFCVWYSLACVRLM